MDHDPDPEADSDPEVGGEVPLNVATPKLCACSLSCSRDEMALNIRNAEAERLAQELATLAGETKTEAVIKSLRDRLARLRRERAGRPLAAELDRIALHCASLPIRDHRSTDEILGYDDDGLPHR